MKIVLDASMALAWYLERADEVEADRAREALRIVETHGASVPGLWYPEVANGLLVAERRRVTAEHDIAGFIADLSLLDIQLDSAPPKTTFPQVLALGRLFKLTGYDATYLELARRRDLLLATFDRKLAEAARSAGVKVFGDPA